MRANCRALSNFKPGIRLPQPSTVGCVSLPQLTPIDKGLQDVLLHGEIVVADAYQLLMEFWEVLHGFVDPIVGHVVGS
jgi:hypothetical protein